MFQNYARNKGRWWLRKTKVLKTRVPLPGAGGYQRSNARVIADSIANLAAKGLISLTAGEIAGNI